MIKTWSYAVNCLLQFKSGIIILEEMPWYVLLIENINDSICGFIGTYLDFKFPDIWKRQWDEDDLQYIGTLKDWFGGFGAVWHIYVCSPIFQWCWKHPKRKSYDCKIGYDLLKKFLHEHDKEFFDEHEEILKEKDESQ